MKRMMPFIGVELNVVSYREKLVSILGGAISIGLLVWICREVIDPAGAVYVIASMAASAIVPSGACSSGCGWIDPSTAMPPASHL